MGGVGIRRIHALYASLHFPVYLYSYISLLIPSCYVSCKATGKHIFLSLHTPYIPTCPYLYTHIYIYTYMTGRIVLSHVHVSTLRGVLRIRSSFLLAWPAEELSRWNTLKILSLSQTEDLRPVAGGGVYGGGGLAYFEEQTWRCDELSARRSIHVHTNIYIYICLYVPLSVSIYVTQSAPISPRAGSISRPTLVTSAAKTAK